MTRMTRLATVILATAVSADDCCLALQVARGGGSVVALVLIQSSGDPGTAWPNQNQFSYTTLHYF
jgi:hypothetical protein